MVLESLISRLESGKVPPVPHAKNDVVPLQAAPDMAVPPVPRVPRQKWDSETDFTKNTLADEIAKEFGTALPGNGHLDEIFDLHEAFNRRAGILEYDANLPRAEAELEVLKITCTLARNRGYRWASLRAALAGFPDLLG